MDPRIDILDKELLEAERDASPNGFDSLAAKRRSDNTTGLERTTSSSSAATSSSEGSITHREIGVTRQPTLLDLEQHPTALSRRHTARSQHSGTVGLGNRSRSGTWKSRDSRRPMPNFGGNKPFPPLLPDQEEYVVEFDGPDDPLHAQNWPLRKKMILGAILSYTSIVSTFTSSVFSTATVEVAAEYGVSSEVGLLGLSLYVLGFATGPTVWAPLSELKGRKITMLISMFGFSLFQLAVASGKDLQTILICRFWGGFFGAAPLAVVAAIFSDMFDNATRGLALTVFSMTVFCGPLLAPFIGGFIIQNESMGWRWTEWIVAIGGFISFGLILCFLEESYPPIILVEKAAELRRRTKNWGIHAKQDEIEVDFRELITKNFSRPLRLLFTEPIILLVSIYMAFIYGLLYLFFTAYPIVFQEIHGMAPGVGGLPYLSMVVGMLIAGFWIVSRQPAYTRKLMANGGVPIPEWRLPEIVVGGVVFALSLFWFGWSGYKKEIHWIVPCLSGIFTGFGLLAIFLQSLNYLVDSYLMFAASAIAGNTLLRSLAGAGFPLFGTYMFASLGVNWAGTLLGCVALALVPIPVLFIKYGAKIRSRSRFAPTNIGTADTAHRESDGTDDMEGNKNALLEKIPTRRGLDATDKV